MEEWIYAQTQPSDCLAKLHYLSVKKQHAGGEVELRIAVKEFATPQIDSLHFFAMTDLPFDQTTQYRPCVWANTSLGALSECLINQYEAPPESPGCPRPDHHGMMTL